MLKVFMNEISSMRYSDKLKCKTAVENMLHQFDQEFVEYGFVDSAQ